VPQNVAWPLDSHSSRKGGGSLSFDAISFSAGTDGNMGTGGGTASVFHDPSVTTLLARDGAIGTKRNAGTVKLTGLTIGYTYRIQLIGSHRIGDE
jgi:hypothetical protein